MKTLMIAILCLAALLLAAPAQAYAIYNHVNAEVCVLDPASSFGDVCKYKISPNGTHNGEHGAGFRHAAVAWHTSKSHCRGNTSWFAIPDGGYARIYYDQVKIYKHDNSQVGSKGIHDCDCPNF